LSTFLTLLMEDELNGQLISKNDGSIQDDSE
jgi:hypothetical protein